MLTFLQEMYRTHPMNLVRVIKNNLATEQRLVQQTEAVSNKYKIEDSTCKFSDITVLASSILHICDNKVRYLYNYSILLNSFVSHFLHRVEWIIKLQMLIAKYSNSLISFTK